MKRSKRIYLLLLVLVFVCAAAFGVTRIEEKKEAIRSSDEIILTLSADAITGVSWNYEDTSLAFHRDGDGIWRYDADEAFPVDEEKMNALLLQFESFGVTFAIEAVEDERLYGLTEPVCTIELQTDDDTAYTVTLGDFSKMDELRYVSIGDGNVYLASKDPFGAFEAELKDFILHDKTPRIETAETITFSGAQDYEIFYMEESDATYCEDDVYFTTRGGEQKPLDSDRVGDYLGVIGDLSLTDYVSYNASDEELQSYGLDEPELSVTVHYTQEQPTSEDSDVVQQVENTFTLHIARDQEQAAKEAQKAESGEDEADDEAQEEEFLTYARVADSQIVYKITEDEYRQLLAASYDELRHRELLTTLLDEVTSLTFTLDDNTYAFTPQEQEGEQSGEQDAARVWLYDSSEIDISAIEKAINNVTVHTFTDEAPDGRLEISYTAYLTNNSFPQVDIALYRYDGESCLATIDGVPVGLVSRQRVIDLIEAVHTIVLQ